VVVSQRASATPLNTSCQAFSADISISFNGTIRLTTLSGEEWRNKPRSAWQRRWRYETLRQGNSWSPWLGQPNTVAARYPPSNRGAARCKRRRRVSSIGNSGSPPSKRAWTPSPPNAGPRGSAVPIAGMIIVGCPRRGIAGNVRAATARPTSPRHNVPRFACAADQVGLDALPDQRRQGGHLCIAALDDHWCIVAHRLQDAEELARGHG